MPSIVTPKTFGPNLNRLNELFEDARGVPDLDGRMASRLATCNSAFGTMDAVAVQRTEVRRVDLFAGASKLTSELVFQRKEVNDWAINVDWGH
jgi:hypothetical protein